MTKKQKIFADISIHAPTKGATKCGQKLRQSKKFQSTLPRRERRYLIEVNVRLDDFNPRSHEGSDLNDKEAEDICRYFNPRSHEGSDRNFIQKSFYILDKINKLTLFHAIFPFFVLLLFS